MERTVVDKVLTSYNRYIGWWLFLKGLTCKRALCTHDLMHFR